MQQVTFICKVTGECAYVLYKLRTLLYIVNYVITYINSLSYSKYATPPDLQIKGMCWKVFG